MPEMEFKQHRISWKIRQLANGKERYEIKVRADTIEEASRLLKDSKDELRVLCGD